MFLFAKIMFILYSLPFDIARINVICPFTLLFKIGLSLSLQRPPHQLTYVCQVGVSTEHRKERKMYGDNKHRIFPKLLILGLP